MENLSIICIDDNRAVLSSLERDLAIFLPFFSLELCESASEAQEIIEWLYEKDKKAALLICDHIMPEMTGIDFLIEVGNDPQYSSARKILLTGQADHKDTIRAINKGEIDYYIEKPWERDEIIVPVKILVTKYIISSGVDYNKFLPILDNKTLYKLLEDKL